jgi:hypothetical protein
LVSRPAIFDDQVSAFNVAGLVQTPPEAGQPEGVGFRRREVQIPDHRHRRLLRARRKRPSRYTAAEKCDEFPPPHGAYPKAKDHELIIAPCIFESFSLQIDIQNMHAGGIATRSVEACHKAKLDRVNTRKKPLGDGSAALK